MNKPIQDINIIIATINGSGSQAANQILTKAIFHHGWVVGAKNIFPSNIAGLQTWFHMRVHSEGYVSRRKSFEIGVALNAKTLTADYDQISTGGVFFHSSEFAPDIETHHQNENTSVRCISVPFKELATQASSSVKLRKLLANVIYVGILSRILEVTAATIESLLHEKFGHNPAVFEVNLRAFQIGYEWQYEQRKILSQEFGLTPRPKATAGKILIDGNTASALGLLFGGCNFLSWYPITPASSIAENFQKYASKYRKDAAGKNLYGIIQAEDELSAISMVIGAAWTGARALTSTSGPGLSLMAEAAGLSYFAEVPTVIWNVQRAGPSTGLPTRTLQSDLLTCAHLSHGDTEHILLIPGSPQECFEYGQTCFDLAEYFQSLVIVLSDLDLGMQSFISDKWDYPAKPYERGQILTDSTPGQEQAFARFRPNKEGICRRSLPGTVNGDGAYFSRGTGHDEFAKYTENPEIYEAQLTRLKEKIAGAKDHVPAPVIDQHPDAEVGLIAYGSTDQAINEIRHHLENQGLRTNYMRIRAYPFADQVIDFVKEQGEVYLIEQNRDAQMKTLLLEAAPEISTGINSILSFNGLPISAEDISEKILTARNSR